MKRDKTCLTMLAALGWGCGPSGPLSLEAGLEDDTGGEQGNSTQGDGDSGDGDPGDGDGDNGIPLALVSATTDTTGATLVLRFSEPMAPPTGVDPADFRVSLAQTTQYIDYDFIYESSMYADPNYYFNWGSAMELNVGSISLGDVATDLVLRFEIPMDPVVCPNLASMMATMAELTLDPHYEGRVGLFPHYSPGATSVRSVDGEALAAIGSGWVEYQYTVQWIDGAYDFPNLSPQIPINCIVAP